tara:strand:+ start:751 stop:1548 length:798 start_codon:yes stop_codon:yes gene_type:complete
MGNTAKGRHALFISDRSGLAFPYREMVKEWNGARVHTSEYEPKQPQLELRPYSADPQGLQHPRPARTEFPTTDFLPKNSFTMTNTSTQVSVSFPFSGYQNGDFIRFYDVKSPVGGVSISTLQLETTLNGNITATDISITLTDSSAFPSQGYIAIEKINETSGLFETETIFYNGNTGNVLSNCVRGTAAPFRGQTPKNTPAGTHSSGAKVYSAYAVTMVPTVVNQAGQPSTVTEHNSFTFNLISAATSTETGGGFQCLAGPVNDRA